MRLFVIVTVLVMHSITQGSGKKTAMTKELSDTIVLKARTVGLPVVLKDFEKLTADGKVLQAEAETCEVKQNATIDACTACVQSACAKTPTIGDYWKVAENYMQIPLNELSAGFDKAVAALGKEGGAFVNGAKNIVNGIERDFKNLGNLPAIRDIGKLAKKIEDGLKNLGKNIGKFFRNPGRIIRIPFRIPNPFGRRRKRAIDAETRACMEKCNSCKPFLNDDTKAMVRQICGAAYVNHNATFFANLEKVKGLYQALIDNVTDPFQVLYEEGSLYPIPPNFRYTEVHIQAAKIKGKIENYVSAHEYLLMSPSTTATNIANEYLKKWDCKLTGNSKTCM